MGALRPARWSALRPDTPLPLVPAQCMLIDGAVSLCSRFHNPKEEPVLDSNVAPHLDDNIQLSIGQYRDKLYEVCVCVLLTGVSCCSSEIKTCTQLH